MVVPPQRVASSVVTYQKIDTFHGNIHSTTFSTAYCLCDVPIIWSPTQQLSHPPILSTLITHIIDLRKLLNMTLPISLRELPQPTHPTDFNNSLCLPLKQIHTPNLLQTDLCANFLHQARSIRQIPPLLVKRNRTFMPITQHIAKCIRLVVSGVVQKALWYANRRQWGIWKGPSARTSSEVYVASMG